MNTRVRFGLLFSLLFAFSLFSAPPSQAGTWDAFGPKTYVRSTGAPVTVTDTFAVLNPATQFTLRVTNGGLVDGQYELVSSSVITLNGVQVVGPSNFNQHVTVLSVPITLQATNEIDVQVRGKPGGAIAVEVIGVDNDPPRIGATSIPPPNSNGWNNTNVTVSFTCSDATSGVASCPPPRTVTTEGASQAVSGTATDLAGNRKSVV